MKLLGGTESKIIKDKNGENIPKSRDFKSGISSL